MRVCLAGVLEEARFFGIEQLAEQIEVAIKVKTERLVISSVCMHIYKCAPLQNSHPPEDHSPISRKEFVRFLLATPTKSELRCQVQAFPPGFVSTTLHTERCLSCPSVSRAHPGAEFQRRRPLSAGPALHQFQDGQLEPLQPHLRQPVLLEPGEGRPLWGQPGRVYLSLA